VRSDGAAAHRTSPRVARGPRSEWPYPPNEPKITKQRLISLRPHKIANTLGALPKSAHPGAKKHLAEIWNAEDKDHALAAVKDFQAAYGAKYPKAVAKVIDDLDELLAFYDYPAEHWVHLRTTNPIESTFATVRHRTKVTKGPGSRAAGLAMAFKLIESAQKRWRAVNAPHLVALVRAEAKFRKGKLVERPEEVTSARAA
ncbi:transposase, partial [Nonomuraea basaltis]|uniref:transposase n=1 Tax=Nonomuraea basaltis TaxID=2495887 RepID=UPI001F0E1408